MPKEGGGEAVRRFPDASHALRLEDRPTVLLEVSALFWWLPAPVPGAGSITALTRRPRTRLAASPPGSHVVATAALADVLRSSIGMEITRADPEQLALRLATPTAVEARRHTQMGELISTSKASAFARALVTAVLNNVPNVDIRERIGDGIS